MRKAIAWTLLIGSTLAGIISFYWLAFAVWMTAHPLYDSTAWKHRVYGRFAITAIDALVWLMSVISLFRLSDSRQQSANESH